MKRIIQAMLGYAVPDEHFIQAALIDAGQDQITGSCAFEPIINKLVLGFTLYYRGHLEKSDETFNNLLAGIQTCHWDSPENISMDEIMVCALIGRFYYAHVAKGQKLSLQFHHRAKSIASRSTTIPADSIVRKVLMLLDGIVQSFTGENVEAISTLTSLTETTGDGEGNLPEYLLAVNSHLRLAIALIRIRDYTTASEHIEKGLVLANQIGYKHGVAEVLRRKAILLGHQKDHRATIELLNSAHEIFEVTGNIYGQIQTLSSLGRNYSTHETKHAEYCFRKAIELAKAHRYVFELSSLYSLMGDVLMIQGRLQSAEKYYMQDYALSQDDESIRRRAYINRNLGRIYHIQNKLVDSVSHLRNALDDFEKVDDKTNYGYVALRLCQCYLDMDSLQESRKLEQKVRAIFGVNSTYESSLCDMMLGMIYRKEQKTEAAIQILKKSLANQERYAMSFACIRTRLELAFAFKDLEDIESYKNTLVSIIKLSRHHYIQEIEDKALELLREVDEKEWSRLRNIVFLGVSSDKQESRIVNMAIMYADIRNYTHITNNNQVERIAEFVNDFFNIVSRIVYTHGGLVNKYIGDCVMSLFGLDNEYIDNEEKLFHESVHSAYLAAIDIARSTRLLKRRWDLKSDIEIGIGIASGPVVAGYFGSLERMEFSVIGSTVNKASRIQNLASSKHALLCENTAIILGDLPQIKPHDSVSCKGFPEMVKVSALIYPKS